MTITTLTRRIAQLENYQTDENLIHVMFPSGWIAAEAYELWRALETARSPSGARCLAVRFVRPGQAVEKQSIDRPRTPAGADRG